MTKNQENQPRGLDTVAASAGGSAQRVQLNLRLQPANNSEQPIFANITTVQAAPGIAFLDFGFVEPGAMSALVRTVQGGGKAPDTINGRLACRVALSPDTAAQLAQQLHDILRPARPEPSAGSGAVIADAPATPQ